MVKINLLKNVNKLGVDGLIIVDLPWPENKIFQKNVKKILLILYNFYLPTTSNIE